MTLRDHGSVKKKCKSITRHAKKDVEECPAKNIKTNNKHLKINLELKTSQRSSGFKG